MIELYKTYNKAKDMFVKPKLKVKFGLWKNMSGLPVWRRGPQIFLAKHHQYYTPKSWQHYVVEKAGNQRVDGTVVKYDSIGTSKHKLPKDCNGPVWRRDIRKKLRKWGLGWLKPMYTLPLWLSFYCFNWDVIYKWKYDTIRYEYPPQFTLVFFGIALSFTLEPPIEEEFDMVDWYWESLLSYLYQEECEKNLEKTLHFCGKWEHSREYGKFTTSTFQLKKHYIKPQYHDEYDKAVNTYDIYLENKKKDDKWLY